MWPVDAAELLAGLDHPCGAPAQRHRAVAPALDIARVITADRDHRFDGVGRAERTREGGWHVQAQHGQGLGRALAQAGRGAGGAVELGGQRAQFGLGRQRGIGVIGPPDPGGDGGSHLLWGGGRPRF
jgi:hypothetical protein